MAWFRRQISAEPLYLDPLPSQQVESLSTTPRLPSYDELEGPLVIVTGYRLLVSTILVVLGVTKATLSYEGKQIAPTTLDLILCVFGTLTLYWLGPLEAKRPKVLPWLFHRDLLQALRGRSGRGPNSSATQEESMPPRVGNVSTDYESGRRLACTMHRVISTITLFMFGSAKAALGYRGQAVAGTTLDWVVGVMLALVLYWVGLLEWSRPGVAPWYFHRDLLTGDEIIEELDPGEYVDHEKNVLTFEFPKYPIKITTYRILSSSVILGFGMAKATLAYLGKNTAPITLDWILGVVAALILYWVGFYEAPRTNVWPSFFQKDHSDLINFSTLSASLGTILFFGFLIGIHLYVTTTFVIMLLTVTPHDNGVDLGCRIVIYIWFGLSAVLLLSALIYKVVYGRLPEQTFGFLFGWYFFYFFLIVVVSMIKATGGYSPPSSGEDGGTKPGKSWTFCISVPFFTYCW